MDLIVTHNRADFDAFASMLLASRLFPEAQPVLPGTLIYKLREFISLYRDVADFPNIRQIKKRKNLAVDRVIVVDTRKSGQLLEFKRYLESALEVLIFDHHPATAFDIDIDLGTVEEFGYGANSTGLYFKLIETGQTLSPMESTIVLLGIYADTGNLTFPGTTADDVLAASLLMRSGADLQTVNHYLRPYFDPAQRLVFREILTSHQELLLEGYKIVFIKQRLDNIMQGISTLISQAADMLGADAILGIFATNGKPGVQIIIQSLIPEINAAELSAVFEGGGHPGAAAAFLPKADLDGVAETLLTLLTEAPLPTAKVRDHMSIHIRTVPAEMPLHETARRFEEHNIRGAPVVDDRGSVIGIISSRDIEKARQQDMLHARTSGFMSKKVITLSPDTPLVSARKLIASQNIGHVPIMEGEHLVGIISRTDILQSVRSN